jgi:hypothetical protein
MMNNKRLLGLSVIMFLVFGFTSTYWAAECPEEWSRRNPLMDYAPQESDYGSYDTMYNQLGEPDCRGCHGASLAVRHHATPRYAQCDCHGVTPERDCVAAGCHATYDNGWHHLTDMSATGQCDACHSDVVEYGSEPLPEYGPSIVTPYAYSCENCHWEQALTTGDPSHPCTYDHYNAWDQYVGFYEYGKPLYTPQDLHHMEFKGNFTSDCYRCHSENDPYNPSWDPCDDYECSRRIRPCQKCHSRGSLHSIVYHVVIKDDPQFQDIDYPYGWHAFGWHVDSDECDDVESTVYRQFANGQTWGDELCCGCHCDRY